MVKKWYEKPYSNTKKTVPESLADIKSLLARYGVLGFQETIYGNYVQLRFIIEENEQRIPFQLDIQLPRSDQKQGERKQMQYMRAYYYYIKSRLETIIEFNIKPFSEEFMPERVLKLPNNQYRTITQIVKDQSKNLLDGKDLFLPFIQEREN